MMMPLATHAVLGALNHVLASASWARQRLAPHAGRSAELRADPWRLRFTVTGDGMLVDDSGAEPPAVTLSLPLAALPQFLGGEADKAMSTVRIEGSADFADALGFVFRNLRWDVEEDLSRVLGDVLAHRLVGAARALRDAQLRALQALTGNVTEYLAEEQALLVTRALLLQHEDELRTLRDDIARLGQRLERLSVSAPSRA